jgi:site-specific recombinase XerD
MANALAIVTTEFAMPAILAVASPKARTRVLEFFGASIRNANTRKAYMTACAAFFDFLADNDVTALEDVGPLHGAAYLEAMKGAKRSVATQKQHMAAVGMLFDYLVTGGILAHNPILSVRAPRQSVMKGKTPTLSAEDAGELLRAIKTNNLAGLRDRALLGLMVFTFARVSAALGVNVGELA